MPQIILVVEDTPLTRNLCRTALEAKDYVVVEAGDAGSALQLIKEQKVDLILQDLGLPDSFGADFVERVRALPEGRHVPIVAMSSFLDERIWCIESAGFVASVAKPIDVERLVQVVRAHLPGPLGIATGVQHSGRILIASVDPVQKKLLQGHLEQHGFTVDTAADGASALSLAEHLLPDAIISDVLMPRMDGFRLCQGVRKNALLSHTPVFLISMVSVDDADVELAWTVGCNAFYTKTLDLPQIVQALTTALSSPMTSEDRQPADHQDADDYIHRVVGYMQRQMGHSKSLATQVAVLEAQLAILAEFASQPAAFESIDQMLTKLIGTSLDAIGVSRGVAYLQDDSGSVTMAAQLGMAEALTPSLKEFFGFKHLLLKVMESSGPVKLPSAFATAEQSAAVLRSMGAGSVVMTPLVVEGRSAGVLVIAVSETKLNDEWSALSAAIGIQVGHAIGVIRIMRRLFETETQLREQSKMAAVGAMAGGIAHEIASPLTVILSKARMLTDSVDRGTIDSALIFKISSSITDNTQRISSIVRGMAMISRKSDNDPFVKTRMASLLDGTIALCAARFKHGRVALEIEPCEVGMVIDCRASEISQALINLLNNAFDAVETADDPWVKLTTRAVEGWVEIAVTDSGIGIAEDVYEKIMQPFFTTKVVGRGTGLGLSISKGIASDHGGELFLDRYSEHTRFVLRLPMRHVSVPSVA